ncbi:MAG: PadR family transcriptional regulator [Candidatus Gastranaerophilales bacterium]|nr:PadR family transcriptional regulator [Candidatus Gastranaerophilales bacterium]
MSEICILYCLTKREMTIYSVKKFITNLFGAFTRASHGTIHPSLKKLLAENCVTVRDMLSEGGKKSSYYSITEKGKKYLTELLLSDLSDNPSVLTNEINIRLSAISHLNKENKEILIQNAIRALDLQTVNIEKMLNDKYANYDENQTAVMKQRQKQIADYMAFLKDFKV